MWLRELQSAAYSQISLSAPGQSLGNLPVHCTVNIRLYALQFYGTLPKNWEERDRHGLDRSITRSSLGIQSDREELNDRD